MEMEQYNLNELSAAEKVRIEGGNHIVIFIAGAIVGGLIYDAYKAACKAAVNVQVNHPEYYDGAVRSQR